MISSNIFKTSRRLSVSGLFLSLMKVFFNDTVEVLKNIKFLQFVVNLNYIQSITISKLYEFVEMKTIKS